MERQLIEDYLEPYFEGERLAKLKKVHENKKISLEVGTPEGLIQVRGLVGQMNYPYYVLIMPVDEDNFRDLMSHSKRKGNEYSGYSLYGMEVGKFKKTGINRALVDFSELVHAIKSVTLDDKLVYTSPFVGEDGIYTGFMEEKKEGEDKIRFYHRLAYNINLMRDQYGFPRVGTC